MRDLALLSADLATRCLCPFIVIASFAPQSVAKRSFFRKQGEAEVSLVIHRINRPCPRIHF
ncbi:hypothetical protein [Helicobacter canis]|uniref:hypothetical protein n=1 Tax=Helicobacter canis TaxID=29419 RepID=UPI000E0E5BBD|nr:hypothetical protein [Helicobacter canis]